MPRSESEWKNIADDFNSRWNMPNCIGALDGKHIIMQAVANTGSTYYNYKGENSIVLMALVDAHRRFIYVDIGCNGRVSDGGVWDTTSLATNLKDITNPLHIPSPIELPGRSLKIPYFIVADAAFPFKNYIMRPFPSRNLNRTKRIFNYRQRRARMNVENAFGILSSRFQIFKRKLNLSPAKVDLFTLTCCSLHNLLVRYLQITNTPTCTMSTLIPEHQNATCQSSVAIRNEIAAYCEEEGIVEWQDGCI